jgi:hypothetical protein
LRKKIPTSDPWAAELRKKLPKVATYKLNKLEITVNFILGNGLPPGHYRSIIELARNRLVGFYSKGGIYLSPLMSDHGCKELLQMFVKIKNMSRLPVYLYLIQRL